MPAGRPARLLLGWLAAFPGEHARAEVAARLWPDVLDSSARASLRTALSELRAALGPAAICLRASRETVELGGDGLWVDLRAFAELVAAGRREEALSLCRGEILEGLDAEWVLDLRSRHAAERANAAAAPFRAARAAGDARSALAWARRLAEWDPLGEAAGRELMLALRWRVFVWPRCAPTPLSPGGWRASWPSLLRPATRELASRLRREGSTAGRPSACRCPSASMRLGAGLRGTGGGGRRLHEAFARARRASAVSRW